MATAKQKAAARRNIKKAIAANRRKGGRKSHRSSRSSAGESHAPGFAAVYQHTKTGLQIVSPVTDDALQIVEGSKTVQSAGQDLMARAKNTGYRGAYLRGAASSIFQAWADRKLRIANALARKSASAIAAEGYAVGVAAYDADLDPQDTHANFIENTTGFHPFNGSFSIKNTNAKTYLIGKYGGAAVRKVGPKVPAIWEPIKEGFHMLGLTP